MSSEDVRKYEDRFISKLVEMRRVSSAEDVQDRCEHCKVLSADVADAPLAEHYCMDCHQKLCANCKCRHPACPLTSEHFIVPLRSKPSDEVMQHMKRRVPYCAVHRGVMASWLCYKCRWYYCTQCQRNHTNHEKEDISEVTNNSEQRVSNILIHLKKTTAELDDMKAAIVKKIRLEAEQAKEGVKKRKEEVIRKIEQEVETLNKEVDLWRDCQLRRCDSAYPSERARRRWIRFVEELSTKGSISEQLELYKPLSERVAKLQEADKDLPELTCNEILCFSPSQNLPQAIVGVIAATQLANASSDLSKYRYLSFTPGSKPTFSTNPCHLRLLLPTGLPS